MAANGDDRRILRGGPPDPGQAITLDGLAEGLRLLRAWAGSPSYEALKDRVNEIWAVAGRPRHERVGKTTVVDCFRAGRRRLNADLVTALVQALHPDQGYVTQWRQQLRVIEGEHTAAAQVRVRAGLPELAPGFTGRGAELTRLCRILGGAAPVLPPAGSGSACARPAGPRRARPAPVGAGDILATIAGGGPGPVAAITGMPGVGKTRLAAQVAHLLATRRQIERVLFVDLRGFHPEQPPADPGAVLDGFLRLLLAGGQEMPRGAGARAALYRRLLAGTRTLVVLDNAAGADQVRPLLPGVPCCPALITSRRRLHDLDRAVAVPIDVLGADEAAGFLHRAAPDVPLGHDPGAAARIAACCGRLPLAIVEVAAWMRATTGWTMTDHADRLEDRRRTGRLPCQVEREISGSYLALPAEARRMLRLLALHPGRSFDAWAAAALTGDVPGAGLRLLRDEHLIRYDGAGRYALHDLVRTFAVCRGHDEDRPAEHRAALARLARSDSFGISRLAARP
ncbi:NB-ARC domain-containing protein [Catenuloplanes japonicus]|uniref:NB-ARC domain-containing protein n=1 Tax=Catenuloplanes japonicus TaxID=33876 RepID=UPI00068E501A|nr:NB-ARC domain-containing protein [Catenuloplanes japonicus]